MTNMGTPGGRGRDADASIFRMARDAYNTCSLSNVAELISGAIWYRPGIGSVRWRVVVDQLAT